MQTSEVGELFPVPAGGCCSALPHNVFAIHPHRPALLNSLHSDTVTSAWLPHELWIIPRGKHRAAKLVGHKELLCVTSLAPYTSRQTKAGFTPRVLMPNSDLCLISDFFFGEKLNNVGLCETFRVCLIMKLCVGLGKRRTEKEQNRTRIMSGIIRPVCLGYRRTGRYPIYFHIWRMSDYHLTICTLFLRRCTCYSSIFWVGGS